MWDIGREVRTVENLERERLYGASEQNLIAPRGSRGHRTQGETQPPVSAVGFGPGLCLPSSLHTSSVCPGNELLRVLSLGPWDLLSVPENKT